MAAEDIGNLFNTKMPGYEDPADIQEALRLYHYGSSAYDPNNSDTAQLVANSIAGHLNTLTANVIFLDSRGIGSVYANSEPEDPENGFIWMNSLETGSNSVNYAVAIYTNDAPTEDLVDGIVWVDKDASPIKAYVYDSLQYSNVNPMAAWIPITELYNIIDAAGDLIYGTAPDDFTRLPIGSQGQVLTVSANNLPSWSSPKQWTQVATGSLTGSTVSVTGLNGERYAVVLKDWSHSNTTSTANISLQFNSNSGPHYIEPTGIFASSALTTPAYVNTETPDLVFMVDLANTSAELKPVSTTSQLSTGYFFGYFKQTSPITSIQLTISSGSFDAGNYYVWSYQ